MRSLEFDPSAFEDLAWWVQNDRKKAVRLIRIIQETQDDPFGGIGKPEPLKHEAGLTALTGRLESLLLRVLNPAQRGR